MASVKQYQLNYAKWLQKLLNYAVVQCELKF